MSYTLTKIGPEVEEILEKIEQGYQCGEGVKLTGNVFSIDETYLRELIISINNGTQITKEPTSVSLNKSTTEVNYASTITLTATIVPSDANSKTGLTWTSSNTSVATISATGKTCKVTGAAQNGGTCTITVRTENGKTASCTVTVNAQQETPKIYIGNVVMGTNPTNPSDVETLFTSSVLNSNINNNYLKSYELSNVLSIGTNQSGDVTLSTPKFASTEAGYNDGMYSYHAVLVPEEYYSGYDVVVGDDITNSGTLVKDTPVGRYTHLDGTKTISFNSKIYHVFGYYISNNSIIEEFFQFTLIQK